MKALNLASMDREVTKEKLINTRKLAENGNDLTQKLNFSVFIGFSFLVSKKGKIVLLIDSCYGRFLIAIKRITPTIAIAIIIAAPMPIRYISVGGNAISGYGDAVTDAAESTVNAFSANEGK